MKYYVNLTIVFVCLVMGISIFNWYNAKHVRLFEEDGETYYVDRFGDTNYLEFSDGLAVSVEQDWAHGTEYWRYIDQNGWVVLEPKCVLADGFGCGLAPITPEENSYTGYIDKTGEFVLPPIYHVAGMFDNGVAVVYMGGRDGDWFIIDTDGNILRKAVEPDDLKLWKSQTGGGLSNFDKSRMIFD